MATRRQPPNKKMPARPRKGTEATVVARLQELIQEKDGKIDKLTERINTLSMENKRLERKIDTLSKAAAGKLIIIFLYSTNIVHVHTTQKYI